MRSLRRKTFHTDQGSQFTSIDFRKALDEYNFVQSFSSKGHPYDNAVVECFFKYLKKEEADRRSYHSLDQLKHSLFSYINGFYNSLRPHSHNRGLSPVQRENLFFLWFLPVHFIDYDPTSFDIASSECASRILTFTARIPTQISKKKIPICVSAIKNCSISIPPWRIKKTVQICLDLHSFPATQQFLFRINFEIHSLWLIVPFPSYSFKNNHRQKPRSLT